MSLPVSGADFALAVSKNPIPGRAVRSYSVRRAASAADDGWYLTARSSRAGRTPSRGPAAALRAGAQELQCLEHRFRVGLWVHHVIDAYQFLEVGREAGEVEATQGAQRFLLVTSAVR